MGTYYYLLDDTKKQRINFDCLIKAAPIKFNKAVQMAMINFMFENQGDNFRMVSDSGNEFDEMYDYQEIDLKNYAFYDKDVSKEIEKLCISLTQ